nr:hypothetical protein [Jeotgalibacillus malaysiensis]
MKKVTKKAGLAGMAVLMGASVVIGGGALQEPVVQTAEAATVKLGKYKVKSGLASSVRLTVNGNPFNAKVVKTGQIVNLIGYKSGMYTVTFAGKKYVMKEEYMKNLIKL